MADQTTVPGASSVIAADVAQRMDPRLTAMFVKPEGVVGVASTFTHFIEPLRAIGDLDDQYSFDIPHTGSAYTDLKNTQLYVRGHLARRDKTKLVEDEKVSIANNFLNSLWAAVSVYVGRSQTEIYSGNHAYKAYVRQLMRFDTPTVDMIGEGMNVEILNRSVQGTTDLTAAAARGSLVAKSRQVEFIGKTHIPFFETAGYLLPECPLRVTYRKNRDAFYVVTDEANKAVEYNFFIDKIGLFVPCINVSPPLVPLLEMQTDQLPASYLYEALDMKQYPLPTATITRKYPRVFEGKLPT